MGTINITSIPFYAFHGCMEEEGIIGGNYMVDIKIETDFSEAAITDDLSKTVDYVRVYAIVKEQMKIRSKLIEHVAKRIADALMKNISHIEKISVRVTKINPPVNGEMPQVSVEVEMGR